MLMEKTGKERYISHVADDGREELVINHLREVSEMASEFARPFGAASWAATAGIIHDIGKYSLEFQDRILRNGVKTDHSTAGAYQIYNIVQMKADTLLSYCVAGHHAGLPDGGTAVDTSDAPTLHGRLARAREHRIPDYGAYADEVEIEPLRPPDITPVSHKSEDWAFSLSFLTRMVFSCLVDADFLCTEKFMKGMERTLLAIDDLSALRDRLEERIVRFYPPKTLLDETRCNILDACKNAASLSPGFFSLTVPTGGGKTYASMRFALNHALAMGHGMKRVIYAIPYTSIVEQNAKVFRDALGQRCVLEHHVSFDFDFNEEDQDDSSRELRESLRLATENWEAPIIMTTNVQLFESLYANKTSRCRKLHNIANSVIILDEAQMIPTKKLDPCIRALVELVKNYGCSVVLCTATQPALDNMIVEFGFEVREIAPKVPELFHKLKRVTYCNMGMIADVELATCLNECRQALCVVNSRRQAKALYDMLESRNIFYLTTLMYPAHRKNVLARIKCLLDANEQCVVVATSLIEAGVDIDFPVVYRALAGIDSMVQAAGRCNREGKRAAQESIVYIFESVNDYALPYDVKQKAAVARGVLSRSIGGSTRNDCGNNDTYDIGALEVIEAYFHRLYDVHSNGLDADGVLKFLNFNMYAKAINVPFKTVANAFKMIEDGFFPVIVPTEHIAHEVDSLKSGFADRATMRTLLCYSVGVYKHDLDSLLHTGSVEAVGDGVYILTDMACYTEETGLNLGLEEGIGIIW